MNGNIVHVVGAGTIGEPLIGLLCDMRKELGIDEITFYKHSPNLLDRPKVKGLLSRGAELAVDKDKMKDFRELGIEPTYGAEEAIERATVVIDCTPKGVGLQNKEKYYKKYEHKVKGFLAQGSEFGFGKPYALGINDEALTKDDKYIHIISCNTHNIAVVIHTLAIEGKKNYLVDGHFVCIRRANDVSQDTNFVPAPQVNTHKDKMGTHHARDAYYLFKTLGHELNIFSSAMKINTQYMHSIWFSLKLSKRITKEEVERKFWENPRVAVTYKKSANLVFSFGRDHGHYGRILNQTVVVLPTIHVRDGKEVIGFCFTPQDGNSLLSSVAATEWFLYPDDYMEKLRCLGPFLLQEV